MDRKSLLNAIRIRAPWRSVANPMIKSVGAHPGLGWGDTLETLLGKPGLSPQQTDDLKAALTEHLVSGEKSLRLYRISESQRKSLLSKAKAKKPQSTILTQAFPGVVSLQEARALGDTPPKFCSLYSVDESDSLVFTGSRSYLERVELSSDSLKASATADGEFESVIGVRKRHVQVYDAIWIPEDSELICVCVDYPRGAPQDFAVGSHRSLEKMLVRNIGDVEAINLWPAVDGLYDSNEGSVVELGFITDDDSVKNLKARRGAKCLREDIYHQAGSIEVGDSLAPFRLTVRWSVQHTKKVITRPELTLPGTARMLFKGQGDLYDAVLRHSLNLRDLSLAVSKLVEYL